MIIFSHAKTAKSAEIYSLSYYTLALEWSQTSLRQESAESLSTPSLLRGTLSEPDVKMGSLTFIRHRMTSSHSSKDLIRPVSGGESG